MACSHTCSQPPEDLDPPPPSSTNLPGTLKPAVGGSVEVEKLQLAFLREQTVSSLNLDGQMLGTFIRIVNTYTYILECSLCVNLLPLDGD
jgi:hypothetical protein